MDILRGEADIPTVVIGTRGNGRGDWLRSLGLGQYDALFRENEIDAEVLSELSEADFAWPRRNGQSSADDGRGLE